MPRVLGRLPYGPDTVPVRSFNYVEQVKGPDHEKYLWTSAAFSFASNMVKSFVNNGWCVHSRSAGGRRGERFAYPSVRSGHRQR